MSSLKYPHESKQSGKSETGGETGNESVPADGSRPIRTAVQAQKVYVDLVKTIPEVVSVLLVEEAEGEAVVTVISATPFDTLPRNKVFDVQVEVMRRMVKPLLGFHLMNTQELPGGSLVSQGMETSQILWSR